MKTLTLNINGKDERLELPVTATLLEVLRSRFDLHGARQTCGIGICGACTVLIDGEAMSSCLMLAVMAEGKTIETIEGLAGDTLDPVQTAFVEEMGFQCSYCTPGMILASKALLKENPDPSVLDIKEYLAGNLCRCGSYQKIISAVQLAAKTLQSEQPLVNK